MFFLKKYKQYDNNYHTKLLKKYRIWQRKI